MAIKHKTLFTTVTLSSLAMTTLLVSSSAFAKERGFRSADNQGVAARAGDRMERRTNRQFARLDADENGVLVLEEFLTPALEKAENRFTRKDADEDGFLTFEEATSGREPTDLSDIAEDIAQCVADVKDETGNEDIIVPNPDDYLSPQEKFDAADTSGDGVIDLTEALAKAESKVSDAFSAMDSDANLEVTLEEFAAHKASRKATRRAVKSCIEELTDESDT